MEEVLARFVSDLMGRLTGPLTMRLFPQPSPWSRPTILAIVPYIALRVLANRVARTRQSRQSGKVMTIWLAAVGVLGLNDARAQDKPKEPPDLGWSNDPDLSLVLTAGNSASQTYAFSDKLRHVWNDARFEFEVNIVRANTSDDRFFMVAPGLESDLDVVAFVEVLNPDRVAGSGDERFRTL